MSEKQLHNFKVRMPNGVINKLCGEHFAQSHVNLVENAKLSLEADEDTGVTNIPSKDKVIHAIKRALLCTILENDPPAAKKSKTSNGKEEQRLGKRRV